MSYVNSFLGAVPSSLFRALSFVRFEPGARACGAIGEDLVSNGERHAVVGTVAEGNVFPGVVKAEGGEGCSLAACSQVFFSRLVPVDAVVASTSNPLSSLLSCFSSDGAPEKVQPCFGVEFGDNGEEGVEFPLWLLETSNFAASPAPPTFRFLRFPLSREILIVRFSLVCGTSLDALSSTGLAGDMDTVDVVFSCSSRLLLSSVIFELARTLAGYFSGRASGLLCSLTDLDFSLLG
uniref:Uncharacterized protein n=1 Tax=Arundo donax TaxID=35708 RepID=A0A0A9F986_ARUDO